MSKVKEMETAVVLEAYQNALERHGSHVAAMEEAVLALDTYRVADTKPTPSVGEEAIHADILFAHRLRTRAAVVQCIADAFIEQELGVTLDVLASRLDTTPRKVRKMMSLRGSGRRGIDQVSDLLLALGTELDFRVERRQRAEQAPPPNEGK
ncbi:MAG: hypothetical protein JO357_08180 [Hyphomicrobiales bacterium]|nr:hypothetical protein [Hyphomicrobiales bacterium]MBV9052814.1 hypothetical protein [Hyphomicrobiales bacterium]MBV9137021.1 hypothetical protein [Hyphomicrobiales bacterium]MBV9975366.1 hypothetical protein [Hyphomicrobiales bacterium]